MNLYEEVEGDWQTLLQRSGVEANEVNEFLEYGAMLLANFGNYRVSEIRFI
jgi:dipeptidyl-peptidase-3